MKYKFKSLRREEIIKMINNEFEDRKKELITNLEINKNPKEYLDKLQSETSKHSQIKEHIDIYFYTE